MTLAENTPSMSHGALSFDAMVGASVGGRRGMSCNELCSGLLEHCLVALSCFVSRAGQSSPLKTVEPRDLRSQGQDRDPAVPRLAKVGLETKTK